MCLSIPQEYGGQGGTFAPAAVLLEERARSGDSDWGVGLLAALVIGSGIAAQQLSPGNTGLQLLEDLLVSKGITNTGSAG